MSSISAVMPLAISDRDRNNGCGLIDILFLSLNKFAQPELFDCFYIIVPPNEVNIIERHAAQYDFINISVINERDLLPALADYSGVGGWIVQQVLKLAVSSIVKTPYYLTFDSDVFCTHPLTEESLLPGGKGLMQFEAKTVHIEWWLSSAYQLGMKTDVSGDGMMVTPAVLATEVSAALIKELSADKYWLEKLLSPRMPKSLSKFHPKFKKRHLWTEYTLYYLYLEKYGLIDKYHVGIPEGTGIEYTLLSEHTVWWVAELEEWDPAACFADDDKSLFCIVQSNTNTPPGELWEKLKRYLS